MFQQQAANGAAGPGVAAAGAAVGAQAGSSQTTSISRMIDLKSLLKFETFQGKKEDWETYKWELYVAMDVLDPQIRTMLEVVEKSPQKDYNLRQLSQQEQQKGREIVAILALTCKGTAAPYIKAAESQNGFDSWRLLCR